MLTSIDLGYGDVKGVIEVGRKKVRFPSVIAPASGTGELAKILGGRAPQYRVSIETSDGEAGEFVVGELALATGATRSWQSDASDRPSYRNLVLVALALLGVNAETDVALGVPLGAYFDKAERKSLRRLVAGTTATVTIAGRKPQRVEIASVKVFPQSLGAYFHCLGSEKIGDLIAGQAVAVADIGFRTSDLLLLAPGADGVAVPVEEHSGSIDIGIGQALQTVRSYLAKEVGASFNPPEGMIERALTGKGTITVQGRVIDLRGVYSKAVKALAGEVEAHIRREWSGSLDYLAMILLAGGGGEVLRSHLNLPGVQVAPDSAYANALGFLELMLEQDYTSAKPL